MFQSKTSGHAKSYFRDALSKADYYIEDQELNGRFNGRIAKQLDIEGQFVDKERFEKLCDNINPTNGNSLTQRTVKDRRVGYDISFHCPKSVSIYHALSDNDTALNLFKESVRETMVEMESAMQTRIRTQNQYDDRDTGKMLWADFIHQTARPVDGHPPDPHLHCHCFTFNVTYDEVENKFKAGQFHNIKRDMPYYQARFQKRLADKFSEKGFDIRKTKNGFELSVIPQKAIDHFSKRTNRIGQVAKEKGITNPKELDELGARTRAKKQKNRTMPELQASWRNQLLDNGINEQVNSETKTTNKNLTAKKTIEYAIDHSFSRASVKRERQILAEGYTYAIDNKDVSLDAIDNALDKDDRVFQIEVGSQTLCTTALVLKEEWTMVQLAREGMGKFRPFQPSFHPDKQFKKLGKEQQTALKHILTSQDQLTMIKGGAGTGKTTLISQAVKNIEKSGKEVFLFAPTSNATHDVLKSEGFENAQTVARFLIDKDLQDQTKGQVLWIDEAGMLGTKDMADILNIANKNKSRVILSGDPRQHSAVDRGDAMRILKTVGYVPQASLETIYRQREENYKSAVFDISKGNIVSGFKKLDTMGSIKESDYVDISKTLADDYLKTINEKKSALVISPTREQARKINQDIRRGLKQKKLIAQRERMVTILDNKYLTLAEKQDVRNYNKGDIIQVNQHMKGIKKGEKLTVKKTKNGQVIIMNVQGVHHILPTLKAKDYDVCLPRQIALSKGDEIRINKPRYDEKGKRLNNGTVLKIKKLSKKYGITAVKISKNRVSEFQLSEDFGNFDYAYCSTSYGAQGKTVDHVFINQPSATFPASNQKQFYVSTSRARENVTIYTDDKDGLLTQIQKSGDRQGATELVKDKDFMPRTVDIDVPKTKNKSKNIDKDYEPDL
ncbi:MobF family relaxase [Winogradskyella sp. SYSU M77433]|uniref:MobF family relaxase n=1 Tax=Winogradskyella sp. SYSU M77433 TaxID=3042722 RepID=UPI0024808734|nr:MobF family relaxase [Winogradskyella sp. SYSU M77433]